MSASKLSQSAQCVALTITCLVQTTAAQDGPDDSVLKVGLKPAAPFVMVSEDGKPKGFSVDLIEAVAKQLEPPRDVQYVMHNDNIDHLEAVEQGAVDLGIAATSFTSDRERVLDFSVPFYRGGLGIVTRSEGRGLRYWDIVASSDLWFVLLSLFLFLVICAHVIWLAERGNEEMFHDNWRVGVSQAAWWTIVTMTTVGYGDYVPRKPVSRVIGVLIIVVGIVLFGLAVGTFSSTLTVQSINSDIRVPNDLRNRPVGVVDGSIAEAMLRRRGIEVVERTNIADVLTAVEAGDVLAAVHDVAVLRHHVPRTAPGLVLVGPTFAEHDYGITFPVGSRLRKPMNIALLQLKEGDPPRYQWMLNNWFESP